MDKNPVQRSEAAHSTLNRLQDSRSQRRTKIYVPKHSKEPLEAAAMINPINSSAAVATAIAVLLCVVFCLSTASAAPAALRGFGPITTRLDVSSNRPYFCRGLDCPSYEVVETKGDPQLRRYKAADYLVTRVNADDLLQGQVIAAKRLLGYFGGDNEDHVKLRPTVPLNSVLITADRGSETVKGKFYFALYLPKHLQDNKAPKPNNREVHITHIRRRAVWVHTFSSPLLTESELIRRGWHLIKDLEYMGRKVDSRFFVFSLYEVPLPFLPHHYEIAVRAKCRKHSDADDQPDRDQNKISGDLVASSLYDDWDDDYPFPEEGGGDDIDDECDDGSDLIGVLAEL